MTKQSKLHLIAGIFMLTAAAAAPITAAVLNAPTARKSKPRPEPVRLAAKSEAPSVLPEMISLDEMVITAAVVAKPEPVAKATSCRYQELEQGGRPGAEFVKVCD